MDKKPLHRMQKKVKSTLKPSLRKKQSKRSMQVKKGDKVKVMRGKYRGKTGKVKKVSLKKPTIAIEDLEIEKASGEKADANIHPSNLQIIKIDLEDPKRKEITEKEESEQND